MTKKKAEFKVTKKDFEVSWFSGKGAGGQHRNKHMNCCRIKHIATGIIKTGQSNRDRMNNQKEALHAIANDPRFKFYCHTKLREIESGQTVEEKVEEMMRPDNLKIEVKDENGQWKEEDK